MKNEEFYKKIKIPKKDQYTTVIFSSSYWLFYIPANVLIILFAPLLLQRKNNWSIPSFHEYMRICGVSAAIVVVLNIIFAWFMGIRPYLDARKGYFWRGNFKVVEKKSSLGSKYIMLKPGNNHRIKVRSEFFKSVRVNDRIFLERTYLGDIMKINKVSSGLIERVKNMKCTTTKADEGFES